MRDFGISPGRLAPGPLNAITDVAGVRVGHATVRHEVDGVAWRTGVTAIWPHAGNPLQQRVYAGTFPLNGFGEMTARAVVDEWGTLDTPIVLTGTNHVGIVYHWTVQYLFERNRALGLDSPIPMVAECDDSYLDGSEGRAIGRDEVYAALDGATSGPVAEGCVGAGTGMQLFGFKGGIGTASRMVAYQDNTWHVGALVLTNFGDRPDLRVDGVPVGHVLEESEPQRVGDGSCIVVLATDAPLSARQCTRLATRAALGLARTGSTARDTSGEIAVAFATGNLLPAQGPSEVTIRALIEGADETRTSPLNGLFGGAVEATEEAIYNALVAAQTTYGRDGHVLEAIPHERLQAALARYRV
jgi:D-aminopeptidase